MEDEIQVVPFYGQLTGETIRQMLQARFAQDYFQIAQALTPDNRHMRHMELSYAISSLRERERCGR